MSSIASPAFMALAAMSLAVFLHARADAALDADVAWGGDGHCGVRLWIPPGLPEVRGVVILNTGIDGDNRGAVDDPRWRAAAELWGFAIVGTYLHGGNYGDAGQGSGQALLGCLDRLAADSGHGELRNAPIAMYGFSHGAAFTYSFTWFAPSRMIAFVCAKTGFPTDADVPAALAVPGVLIYGQYDDGHVYPAESGLFARHRPQGARWTLAEDWGKGHEYGNTEALAMPFLDRAIALRIPPGASPSTGPVALIEPPVTSGWLADLDHLGDPLARIAPADQYVQPTAAASSDASSDPSTIERNQAGWLIDGTTAVAWRASSSAGAGANLVQPEAYSRYDGDSTRIDLVLDDSACSAHVVAVDWYDGVDRIGTSTGRAQGAWRATLSDPARGLHAITAIAIGSQGEHVATRVSPIFVMSTQSGGASFTSSSDAPATTASPPGSEVMTVQPGAVGVAAPPAGRCGAGSMIAICLVSGWLCSRGLQRPRRNHGR